MQKYCLSSIILRLGTVLGDNLIKGPIFDLLNGNPLHMSYNSNLSFIDNESQLIDELDNKIISVTLLDLNNFEEDPFKLCENIKINHAMVVRIPYFGGKNHGLCSKY